ncbi:hypothetical protein EDB81DRAFT_765540 [Dactylonectria macrodidyma]|uniref:Uncharacterized protein n=1 Tax=Dactylonectria macrodidyma TaxID=307937 RepID=A0A9P9DTI5_9HYPO|nr:hypothetical protein EDB81DRAFT_765540 [Dactylonectria macrodidyma]
MSPGIFSGLRGAYSGIDPQYITGSVADASASTSKIYSADEYSETSHREPSYQDVDAIPLKTHFAPKMGLRPLPPSGAPAEVGNFPMPAWGIPTRKRLLNWKEILLVMTCLVTCIIGVVTVGAKYVAVRIGQTYQLVILGFCISIMGFCTRKSLQRLLLCIETSRGATVQRPTILQNLDAILFCNPIAEGSDWHYRLILLVLLLAPLGFGAAYKIFSGGESTMELNTRNLTYGLTGPPGTQHVGFGLSQFVNATSSWLFDPGFNRTYGFNMFVQNSNTTIMLDGPIAKDVQNIQGTLRTGDFKDITATVNATICSLNTTLMYTRDELDASFTIQVNAGGVDVNAYQNFVYNTSFWFGIMIPDGSTYSTVWISWWTDLLNQSFGSEVGQYNLHRQAVQGRWRITRDSVSLINATVLPGKHYYDGLENTHLAIGALFSSALTEYDYKFLKYSPSRWQSITKYAEYIRNDATVVASVVWARITALHGSEAQDITDPGMMKVYSADTAVQLTRVTLKQGWDEGWKLYLMLIIQPSVMLVAITVRLLFYSSSPVSEDFGLISFLAAVKPDTLGVLHGAGYSGKLIRPLPMRFCNGDEPGSDETHMSSGTTRGNGDIGKISALLGQGGNNAVTYRGRKYK